MIKLKGYVHDYNRNFFKETASGGIRKSGRTTALQPNALPKRTKLSEVGRHSGKPRRIKRASKKRQKENREYTKLRKQFLEDHPTCGIQWDEKCGKKSRQVHHVKRRGKYYLKTDTWKASCNHCHRMVEENGAEAEARGHLIRVRKIDRNNS